MSQSPEQGETSKSYEDGWAAIYRMIREGRSFSGRERHCAFLNTGGERFAGIGAVAGLDLLDDGRAVCAVDWDQDGALDFWISGRGSPRVRLLRNRARSGHHWLELQLVGKQCNRDAIGARVEVMLPDGRGRRYVKTLHAGQGFLAQSSKVLHFGLASSDTIDRVVVHWPGGDPEIFEGIDVDRRWHLEQGSGRGTPLPVRRVHLASGSPGSESMTAGVTGRARVVLATPLPMPRMTFLGVDGAHVSLEPRPERALLINLWASWCANCQKELRDFHDHADQLDEAGVDVLSLSVDKGDERAAAQSYLDALGWKLGRGYATDELLDVLRTAEEEVIDVQRDLALPTSFLMTPRARLIAIYRGPVDVETLTRDARLADMSALDLRAAAVPFPGQFASSPPNSDLLSFVNRLRDRGLLEIAAEFMTRLRPPAGDVEAVTRVAESQVLLANDMMRQRRFPDAATAYTRALELVPGMPAAIRGLGIALGEMRQDDKALELLMRARELASSDDSVPYMLGLINSRKNAPDLARTYFEEAIAKNPRNARAHFNLGALLLKQGLADEALVEMDKALEADPEYAKAHSARAQILYAARRVQEAVRAYRRALELDPDDARTVFGYGVAQVVIGDETGSAKSLARLRTLDPKLAGQLEAVISQR